MTARRRQLAQEAIVEALRTRKNIGLSTSQPVCVLDAAEQLGLEVRLVDIPSMEGLYCRADRPTIILSTLRPVGRQNFTCAHEIAHHVLGHGEQFDELLEQKSERRQRDPKEFMADCFAGAFLMPKTATSHALAVRTIDLAHARPEDLYSVANWFGVGYGTLIQHLWHSLSLIDAHRARHALKIQPQQIRRQFIGDHPSHHLVVADEHWTDVAIDLEVGDLLLLPVGTHAEGTVLQTEPTTLERNTLQRAMMPGIGRVTQGDSWSAFVRVRRKEYVGLARHRFEEEISDGW